MRKVWIRIPCPSMSGNNLLADTEAQYRNEINSQPRLGKGSLICDTIVEVANDDCSGMSRPQKPPRIDHKRETCPVKR
jgi:hypothetical protein